MRTREWLNWLLYLLTGHQDVMATTPDMKSREEDPFIRLLKTHRKTPKNVRYAASSHHLLTLMLCQTHTTDLLSWNRKGETLMLSNVKKDTE